MNTTSNGHQPFNPNQHLSNLKGKDYLEVKWRLVWFRDQYPHGKVKTKMLHLDLEKGIAVFKASVDDGEGGIGEGHGSESIKDFADYIEKAETKAQGRALAVLGFGTQFTGDELNEQHRIVDAPVSRPAPARVSADGVDPAVRTILGEVNALGMEWDAWKKRVLGAAIADKFIKPQQIAKLQKAIEEYKASLEPAA